jgi:hypothetical protein
LHRLHLSVPSADLLQRGHLNGLSSLIAISKIGIIVIGSSWDLCLVFLLIDVYHLRPLAPEESHVFLAGAALVLFGTFIQLNLDVRAISFVLICLSQEEHLPPGEFKEAPTVPKEATRTTCED